MNEDYNGEFRDGGETEKRLNDRFLALAGEDIKSLPKRIQPIVRDIGTFQHRYNVHGIQAVLSGAENFDTPSEIAKQREHNIEYARRLDVLELMMNQSVLSVAVYWLRRKLK